MVVVKEIHKEIVVLLKNEFDLDEFDFDLDEDIVDEEICFKLNGDCNCIKINEILENHFGDNLQFHTYEVAGLLGILILSN